MNKEEAMIEMIKGERIRHTSFSDGEFCFYDADKLRFMYSGNGSIEPVADALNHIDDNFRISKQKKKYWLWDHKSINDEIKRTAVFYDEDAKSTEGRFADVLFDSSYKRKVESSLLEI